MVLASGDLDKGKESNLAHGSVYRFEQFVLDSRKRMLSRADSPVFLTPKAFDVLAFLVQNPNRLVTKEELLKAVWADTFVEEGNLTQHIFHLRKALGDNSEDTRLILTIARKGYQFTANVTVGEAAETKRAAVQVPTAENLGAEPPTTHELPIKNAVPELHRRWRKAAVVGASAALLVVVGFVSWRHFRAIAPPPSGKIMLAVLPFENLTGDSDKEYLADGLTEEMAARPLPSAHRYHGMLFAVMVCSMPLHVVEHASQIRQFLTSAGVAVQPMPGDRGYTG